MYKESLKLLPRRVNLVLSDSVDAVEHNRNGNFGAQFKSITRSLKYCFNPFIYGCKYASTACRDIETALYSLVKKPPRCSQNRKEAL